MRIQNITSQNFTSGKAYFFKGYDLADPQYYPAEFRELPTNEKLDVIYDLLKEQDAKISTIDKKIKTYIQIWKCEKKN